MGTLKDAKESLGRSRALPSQNLLRVANPVIAGELITFAGLLLECCIGTTVTTTGNIPVDISGKASLIAASGTLTSDGTNVTDNDTTTIGSTVYRYKDTLAAAYDVKIGADAEATLANLKKAINATGTAGTEYFAGTLIHPTVSAGAITATTLVVTAKTKGTVGNAIASTEASTHLSWGAATLASGADTSAADFTTALEAAVNTLAGERAYAIRETANYVLFFDVTRNGHVSKACSETMTGANNAWAAAASYGGAGLSDDIPAQAMHVRTINAHDVLLGYVKFWLAFTPGAGKWIVAGNRAGVPRAYDGTVTITGRVLKLANAGSVAWQADDVITLLVQE